MFKKWQLKCDKGYQALTWLGCQMDMDSGKMVIDKLTCNACLEDKI